MARRVTIQTGDLSAVIASSIASTPRRGRAGAFVATATQRSEEC
jgi:hypothetical protein